MTFGIVSVGAELMNGRVQDVCGDIAAEQAACRGFACVRWQAVSGGTDILKQTASEALSCTDTVLFIGGIESVLTDIVSDILKKTGPVTTDGCILENGVKTAVLLPKDEEQTKRLLADRVLPHLEKKTGRHALSKELRFSGIGPEEAERILTDAAASRTAVRFSLWTENGQPIARLTAACADDEAGEKLLAPVVQSIRERAGAHLYSADGEKPNALCARLLTESHRTLAVAESCTGGLLTSALVDIPGSSVFLMEGAVTYSNGAKMRRLGVLPETLERYDAVSRACAMEMASGVRLAAGTDFGISTTGIAGPGGGTAERPVGLVYIGFSDAEGTEAFELHLTGDRTGIRNAAVQKALDILLRKLLN